MQPLVALSPCRPVTLLASQSGAMFGLDARIALGIFSAIALIVGFVGFQRVEIAKEAALIADIEAIENAINQYQVDMGTFYLFTLNRDEYAEPTEDLTALWDKSKVKPGFQNNWHGPYLQRESRARPPYGLFSLFYAQPDRQNTCTADSDCSIWLSLSKVPADVWNKVNAYYDEAGGKAPEAPDDTIRIGKVQSDGAEATRLLLVRTVNRPKY